MTFIILLADDKGNLINFCHSFIQLEDSAQLSIVAAFSLKCPVAMEINWNKRKCLHKKRDQLPQDWFRTSIIFLVHQHGCRDVMRKTFL